jgi:NAD(P)-dependent dehydrogenase (short-subunit alcohol dehydrogenase family)
MDFTGKVVLVTGAAGNLGRAVAQAFAASGAALVLFDIDEAALRNVLQGEERQVQRQAVDLFDAAAVSAAVERVLNQHGRIDVLCNVAGGFRMGHPVHDTPPDVWRLMMDLNPGVLLNMAHAVVPGMLSAGSGKIVHIGAMAGLQGRPDMGAYSAAKSAVIRLTESMAAELREKGINVNCILPSILDTPQNRADMPKADPHRWVAPAALADVALFLASERARAIHGAAIPVTGLS